MTPKLVASWTAAFVLGSLLFDWYAVPIVGGVCGWFLIGRSPVLTGALASGLAWMSLLAATSLRGPVGDLADLLSAIMGVPNIVLYLGVGLFPALLAGSAAAVTGSVREALVGRSRS